MRWSWVRVGSRRCVIPGCFAEVVGGLRARCGFHWIKWCYHGARISGEHLVRTCIFLIIISGIHRYEFLLSAIEWRLYQINPAGNHGPSTKEEQDPDAVQLSASWVSNLESLAGQERLDTYSKQDKHSRYCRFADD